MKRYLFEFHVDGGLRVEPVCAVDSLDAFDMFRADHPRAIISHVYVELFGGAP